MMNDTVKLFWNAFIGLSDKAPKINQYSVKVEVFGNSEEMADDLLDLVLQKKKTATSSASWDYEHGNEDLPKAGDYRIILNGQGEPKAIIQTIKVDIIPFNEVSEEFAYKEGEGDQSLSFWRKVHEDFFRWVCGNIGKSFKEDMPIVCEEFEVVYV